MCKITDTIGSLIALAVVITLVINLDVSEPVRYSPPETTHTDTPAEITLDPTLPVSWIVAL